MALTKISTGGVKDDAASQAIIADEAVDEARLQISNAGSNGQFLQKQSGNTGGLTWAAANEYTHPNHSGEVTSNADGAQTIATNVVDEDNLKISNAGTNGQFLQKQSGNTGGLTWADVTIPPAGNTFTAVANGSIANNKVVKLDSDGKVSQVAESITNLSVPTAFSSNYNVQYTPNSVGASYLRLARVSDTQYAALWKDSANKIRARIITVSSDGTSVSVHNPLTDGPQMQEVNGADSNAQDLDIAYDPNRGKLLAVWTATSSYHCYGKVGTVSGTGTSASITWDSSTTEIRNGGSSDPTYGNKLVWNEDTNNFGYFCYTRGSDDKAYGRVVTINSSGGIELGTMLTLLPFGSESQPIQEFYSLDAIYDTTNNKFGVWVTGKYTSGSKYRSSGAVCTTSGSGTSATLSMVNYYQGDLNFWQYNDSSVNGRHKLVQCCYDPSKDLVLTTYIDEDTTGAGHNHLYVRLFKQSGNEYFPGTTSTMVAATTSTWSIVYSPGINKPVLIWINSSGQVESKILTISGTSQSSSISYSTSTVIHSGTSWNDKLNSGWQYQNLGQWCRAVASAAGGRILLPVQTTGHEGWIVPLKLQNVVSNFTVADSYVGFADAAYTNGQTVTVKTVGNNVSTLSGLTIGSKYYVQGDGTVGTSAGSPSAIAGIAIAADKLLIREPT